MATEKSALRVTELDYNTIRQNLKTYLQAQEEFQDYDFEGSGLSILLDLLAYNTHYNAYYTNMLGNEMFLDTAQLRASVLSHAKLMKYVPKSQQGALSRVNITVTPSATEDQVSNSMTLEKYTKFMGTDKDGVNHQFVAINSNTAIKTNGTFSLSNVYIKQGEVVSLQYAMSADNETRSFTIPSSNVDSTSITIRVQNSASDSNTRVFTQAEDITELDANSRVYFLEENEDLRYKFYFGDGILGEKPIPGNIILCTYLDNAGAVSNNISRFALIEPIGGEYSDNVSITSTVSSYGGIDKETIEEVRFRAPYYYSSQNRAVIKEDYETLILKDFTSLDSVSVWGGEDNDPVIYGKVFISLKTSGNYQLTNLEKERIKTHLISTRNVMTVTPEIVDPDYVYVLLRGTISYNPSLTSKTAGELEALVLAAIDDYNNDELNRFRSVFRKSKLQQYIENCDPSITGSDIDVAVQKRFLIDTTRTKTYEINYNLPLRKSVFLDRLITYPEIEMYDAGGITRRIFIEEVPDASTGIAKITVGQSGKGFLTPPTITIIGDGSGAKATAQILSGRISSIDIDNPGTNYSFAQILITSSDGSGATAIAKLQSRLGTLRTYYFKTNGEKRIVNPNIGSIDYDTGLILLNSARIYSVAENDFYDTDYLTMNIYTDKENIPVLRNRILTIDTNDPRSIQINMISDSN